MNNNRGNNNNRRRGRGNRPQGGGQQTNRVDSRARGNAPQLLEKYRKLAHDAHLNGDRVQAEYYLQYADHYFRVSADGRQRQDEQRLRRDDRWEGGADDGDDAGEFAAESDFPGFDQPSYSRPPRDDRPRPARQPANGRFERDEEAPRPPRQAREDQPEDAGRVDEAEAQANPYEPQENPFVRDNRARGGLRPRRDDRRPRSEQQGEDSAAAEPAGFDPASLPPSISVVHDDSTEVVEAKPRRGRPRKKPTVDDAGEALASVS